MSYLDTLSRHAIRASVHQGDVLWLEPAWLVTEQLAQFVKQHREGIIAEVLACAAPCEDGAPGTLPARTIIWVATNMDWFDGTDPRAGYETLDHPFTGRTPGVCYRQLDPTYYAWMEHTVDRALKAYNARRLAKDTYHRMRWSFNPVEEWAHELFGKGACEKAMRTYSPGRYVPPSEETYAAYRRAIDEAYAEHQRRREVPSAPISEVRKQSKGMVTKNA